MVQMMRRAALSWPMTFLSLAWLALFSQTEIAADFHGSIYPVVSPVQVTSVEPVTINGIQGSRISGYATIERGQCDYMNIEWTLDGRQRSVAVTAFFADAANVRGPGRQEWQALMVGVPPYKLSQTSGDVRHRCGMFPVSTPFFRPDDAITPSQAGATGICHDGAYTTSTGPGTCSGHGGVREWMD